MTTLVQEKVKQAVGILQEQQIDCWLTFVRESGDAGDPVLPLIYGHNLTWHSALIITRRGDTFALLGEYETDTARKTGAYNTVIGYHESIRRVLLHTLERIYPNKIAVNYCLDEPQADGLTYGMYQTLVGYFEATPWEQRLTSAQGIIAALRGRKTPSEIAAIRSAIAATHGILDRTLATVQPGMSELQIADFMHARLAESGLQPAWPWESCPIVNAGPDSPIGHTLPGERILQPGQILHLDFGVKVDGYCSDVQAVAYVRRPGEDQAPQPVQQAFDTVVSSIQAAAAALRPGVPGREVDAAARQVVTGAGYKEYKYATGHQLGRMAHDGGALLGPLWERYGNTPNLQVEAMNVFTLEPGVTLPEYGHIGLEEDVLVTIEGAEFLTTPQAGLVLI